MNFMLPESQYSKPAQRAEFFETLLARVRNIPGVQAAGFGAAVPGQGYYSDSGFLAEEHAPLPVGQSQSALSRTADPGYFAALGIPFLRGETFAASQRLDRAMKVVLMTCLHGNTLRAKTRLGSTCWRVARSPTKLLALWVTRAT
jgi:hypothetical protein